jgi:hypothetical protein
MMNCKLQELYYSLYTQPVDNYWGNENVCVTPITLEAPGVLQPCGAVEETLLLSVNGSIAGKLFVFQTADMMLYVTFQVRGSMAPS